jgi:hypothetical protein
MAIVTAMLMSSVIHLSGQKKENLRTIDRLNNSVNQLQEKLTWYEKEKSRFDFYRFKESVFNMRHPEFTQIARAVYHKSKQYGFSPYLIMALIQVESNFDPGAISTVGAYGLMQVNYSVWKDTLEIDYDRVFEIEYNIELGLKILKHYYKKAAGNIFMALFRYNNGYKYNNTGYNKKIVATKYYSGYKSAM